MSFATKTRFRRAPWGRKKHLLPLPILSVLLLVTAMAAPSLLRMTVTIVDDTHLKFTASVQNVVHPSGPTGKIVGIMTVMNKGSSDIQITAAQARIQSLTGPGGQPDTRLDTTITISVPLTVKAGTTVTVPFSGPFAGNVMLLKMGDSFRITPLISWTSADGSFSYSQVKTCTGPATLPVPNDYWDVSCTNS
jgi:hypothetical protein